MAPRHPRATLTEPSRYRYRLAFTDDALDEYGAGSRILSLALPLEERPTQDHPTDAGRQPVSAFLEGLLPEGNLRAQIAGTLRVLPLDKLALLEQVGAECAGAVQFLRAGERPTAGTVRPLTTAEVDTLVADLPTYHLPDGAAPQATLAGIQDKVLLTRLDDGTWGWPEDGAASSHLIKPEPTGTQVVANLVQTEDWPPRVAAIAGPTAPPRCSPDSRACGPHGPGGRRRRESDALFRAGPPGGDRGRSRTCKRPSQSDCEGLLAL